MLNVTDNVTLYKAEIDRPVWQEEETTPVENRKHTQRD